MVSLSKRILDAIEAFNRKDVESTKKAHTSERIKTSLEEHKTGTGAYIGEAVYGALDGIVTTFAVVAGVEGARLSSGIVLILGFANLIGDGLSMGVGSYLSTKSQREYQKSERVRERWEIDNYPDGEIEEIRQIYKKKGFRGEDLDRAVQIITSDKEVWVDTMMVEELGILEEDNHPFFNGLSTFVSFLIAGFIPLLFFVVALAVPSLGRYTFEMSVVLTGLTLFTVGSLRVLVTQTSWWRSGLEMLLVGGMAALGAYLVGYFLRGLA
ncbi:MAG: VIT1/CCC1 transporter family protein [Candidatus Zixiibacteriota bacterium]|nr:MAG: VIT1/CCC1 transporter family protein [candidate division Zixibacteria bacterium]